MTELSTLHGIGGRSIEKLKRLRVHSIEDLLLHLPLRYQDRTKRYKIAELRPGQEALIEGRVTKNIVVRRGRRMMLVTLIDESGSVTLRFFNFSFAQQNSLRVGCHLRCYGETRATGATREMIHPEYTFINPKHAKQPEQSYTPIYPLTEGLLQHELRKLTSIALHWLSDPKHEFEDLLPPEAPDEMRSISLKDALQYIHRPPADADTSLLMEGEHVMQRRLAFEELLARSLSLHRLRREMRQHNAPRIEAGQSFAALEQRLPFELTGAQKRVIAEVRKDLNKTAPTMRLVQGDVGSGKTLIAAAAMLDTVDAGYQVALMAPTEVLAEQHYKNLSAWLQDADIEVTLLVGKQKAVQRRTALRGIEQGYAKVVIGTHALYQKEVRFHDLALVIVDEQHRFGVHQRLTLKEKGGDDATRPHQLIMTATPIPRSLAMVFYADLDHSVVDELPPDRKPVQTTVMSEAKRADIIRRVREVCAKEHQCYWICPLIEESEHMQFKTVQEITDILRKAMPDLTVGCIYGRMTSDEKAAAMRAFEQGETRVLVATTVIEVGVDVPTANFLVIENAERFGLAQLHQLRGRIGRGTAQGYCILLYQPPLSGKAETRLGLMRCTTDGFKIASEDLKLRGAGEILGTRQTGDTQFKIAGLLRNPEYIQAAQELSAVMVERHPETSDKIIRRWLGDTTRYGEV